MINIYQLFPRTFGNKLTAHQKDGSIQTNGCGKFSDIDQKAIRAIKDLGITHIWLTGIIRHAKLTDYSLYGIPSSHPSVVKGMAGSPYAISDYYDVDPDLADNVPNRMQELENLIERIHKNGLKAIIDFIPNHLAREYKSITKPKGVLDFGEKDNKQIGFHPNNNFYYIPNHSFVPPYRAESIYQSDVVYTEQPARVTGNDCFVAEPSTNDWFETIKLNYGIDYKNLSAQHFDPVPDTWNKMTHILKYWASKGIDGFRADMAEMVPVAFWRFALQALKQDFPQTIAVAEIYQPGLYHDFVEAGFDFLYDKVGLYNRLTDVMIHGHAAESISICWKMNGDLDHKMLRFMENHDEVRLASHHFVGDALKALPSVCVSSWMHKGAFMIYNGQESGEKAEGETGFSGEDGRTSIFDYCHMPMHQRWMNAGEFDGGKMFYEQKILLESYKKILRFRLELPALREGNYYDLMWANPWYTEYDPRFVYSFLRFTESQCLLVVANFNQTESRKMRLNLPEDAMKLANIKSVKGKVWIAKNLFKEEEDVFFDPEFLPTQGIFLQLGPAQTAIYNLLMINEVEELLCNKLK